MAVIPNTLVKLHTNVRDVLNGAGGSVSDELRTFFSASAKLNPWSKYKPVIYAAAHVDNDYRWKGDGNCGFSFPNSSNYVDIPGWYDSNGLIGMNGWVYNIPSGGASAPMRLGDFRGYCTVKYPLAQGFHLPETGGREIGDTVQAQIMINGESEYGLAPSNIVGLGNCYFGVYLVSKTNASNYRLDFGTTPGGGSCTVRTEGLGLGDWVAYPFFSNKTVHESGTKYYPVPDVAPRTISIVESVEAIQIRIAGEINSVSKTCTYKILAKNTGGADTVAKNAVYLKYDGNDLSTALQVGEKNATIESLSIPTNTSYGQVYTGTFSGLDDRLMESGKLWVTLGTGKYTASVYPMKSPTSQTSE